MIPVDLGKPFSDHQAQPQEQRQFWVGQISRKPGDGVHEPILEDIGWIDAPADAAIESGLDHSTKPGTMSYQRFANGCVVTPACPLDQTQVVL
jgi:hypothetical protein